MDNIKYYKYIGTNTYWWNRYLFVEHNSLYKLYNKNSKAKIIPEDEILIAEYKQFQNYINNDSRIRLYKMSLKNLKELSEEEALMLVLTNEVELDG